MTKQELADQIQVVLEFYEPRPTGLTLAGAAEDIAEQMVILRDHVALEVERGEMPTEVLAPDDPLKTVLNLGLYEAEIQSDFRDYQAECRADGREVPRFY